MISKWTPNFMKSIRLQSRSAARLDRNSFWSSSRKPNLNQAETSGKINEGKYAFPHGEFAISDTAEKGVLMGGPLISQSFGRFNGFSGENKFYFLQVTGLLLLLNIATRLVFASKEAEPSKA
jgi:hypothetical protein